jgi:uncharacterized repeat protein (TIGR01451 family)
VAVAALGAVIGTSGIVGLVGPTAPAHADVTVPAGCQLSGGGRITCTFGYTGDMQRFDVPSDVTSITVTAWGGDGGSPAPNSHGVARGGHGAVVTGTMAVPHGFLTITVGGDGTGFSPAAGGLVPGGFGEGPGGGSDDTTSGAGGGGGTSLSAGVGGRDQIVLLAGGGGGGGDSAACGIGGAGGDAGHNGEPAPACGNDAGPFGGVAGGAGGAAGGGGVTGATTGGGGGGGGFSGGTGGQGGLLLPDLSCCTAAGGGGGGSSFVDAGASGVDLTGISDRAWGQNGLLTISWAGPDSTAPVAHPAVTAGAPNATGWSHAPVRVDWNWTDDTGIDPSSCPATSTSTAAEGIRTLTATCTDVWGNVGSASVPVQIDTIRPVDAPVVSHPGGGTTVDWNWTDATSGVDGPHCRQQSTIVASFGTLTASCTDVAGNSATDTVTVADTVGPADAPVVSPAANAAGWNNTDVSVAWHWTDSGSGVDPAHCTQQSTSSGEGVQSLGASCADVAGNTASDSVTVQVDKTKPVDAPLVSTSATGASVTWNWSDAVSGVDAARCAQSSSQTGTGQLTLTSTCTDLAGNTATDSRTVTVTPPSTKADVQVTITGPATGRTNTAYTYTLTSKNAGPAAASQVGTTVLLPQGATLVSATGTYTRIGGVLVWRTVPSLAVNASTTYTVVVKFSGRGSTGLAAASASLSNQDPNLLNNAAAVLTKIS